MIYFQIQWSWPWCCPVYWYTWAYVKVSDDDVSSYDLIYRENDQWRLVFYGQYLNLGFVLRVTQENLLLRIIKTIHYFYSFSEHKVRNKVTIVWIKFTHRYWFVVFKLNNSLGLDSSKVCIEKTKRTIYFWTLNINV